MVNVKKKHKINIFSTMQTLHYIVKSHMVTPWTSASNWPIKDSPPHHVVLDIVVPMSSKVHHQ